jgi:hypothetical protein
MAAPRKYPEEMRQRAIRFALDLFDGPEKMSSNAAVPAFAADNPVTSATSSGSCWSFGRPLR